MSSFINSDGYQLPAQEWSSTAAPAIPAITAIPAVSYSPEPAFVEMQKHGVNGVGGLAGAKGVAVSPDGSHVYVATEYVNSIAVFSRASATGALTFVEMHQDGVDGVDGLAGANGVTVSPDGSHVYAASRNDSAIAVFSRDSSTGALTFVEMHKDGVDGVDGIVNVSYVTVSPDGSHIYAAGNSDSAIAVFSRDSSTGALTFVEMHKDGVDGVDGIASVYSVTVSPDGSHVYAAGRSDSAIAVFSRDSSTGALTFVEMHKDGVDGVDGIASAMSVTVSPDGSHVYAAGSSDSTIAVFSRDSSTGALTYVEAQQDGVDGVDGIAEVNSVTVSPDGSHVYAAGRLDSAIAVFSRDSDTGALTYVGMYKDEVDGVDGISYVSSVTVSPDSSHVYAVSPHDYAIAVFSPYTTEAAPVLIRRAVPAVPEEPASTAYAGCGTTNGKCTIYDNTQPEFKILKVPAIIERDTGEVKGHYLIEFYGTTGYSSEITLAPDTVDFSDQPGAFPGGIAIWKIDNTEQKVKTDICRTYFGHSAPTLARCDLEFIKQNGSLTHRPEFYPLFPTISGGGGQTSISSFHLFPWWYSPGLPFGDDFEQDLSDMPYSIELPVLEIPPYGTSTTQTTEFGGGSKVAIVTLSFESLVDELKSRIRVAYDSGQGPLSEFETYETNGSAEFTIQVRKLESPVPMTYADHIRPGQMQFVTGDLADEVLKYGYHIQHR
jgi:6-phosphogluconolactonase (cycloisomerase 2 family)